MTLSLSQLIMLVVMGLATMLWFMIRDKLNTIIKEQVDMEDRISKVEDEMIEFQMNYNKKFELVNKNISDSKAEILEKFHSSKEEILITFSDLRLVIERGKNE